MFDWFKKQSPTPNGGPDFSDINSKEKAEARLQSGELEKLFLLPPEFGGIDDPRNICFVPRGFVAIKQGIDTNIIKPLIDSEKITEYQATPEYQGKSFVPVAIKIVAVIREHLTQRLTFGAKPWQGGLMPNKSPEPTAVGAVSSAIAVHVASRRWLSFFR